MIFLKTFWQNFRFLFYNNYSKLTFSFVQLMNKFDFFSVTKCWNLWVFFPHNCLKKLLVSTVLTIFFQILLGNYYFFFFLCLIYKLTIFSIWQNFWFSTCWLANILSSNKLSTKIKQTILLFSMQIKKYISGRIAYLWRKLRRQFFTSYFILQRKLYSVSSLSQESLEMSPKPCYKICKE